MTTPPGGQDQTPTYITAVGGVLGIVAVAAPVDWVKWPLVVLAFSLIVIGLLGLAKAASPKHWKLWLASSFVPALLAVGGVAIAHNAQAKAHATPYCSQPAAGSTQATSVLARGHGGASLHLDKVVASEQPGLGLQGCAGFDITLRNDNPGRHTAVVDEVDIHILKAWPLKPVCVPGKGGGGTLTISNNYQTVINLADNADGGSVAVDQVTEQLGPHDADRFTIMAKLTSFDLQTTAYLVEAQIKVYANDLSDVMTSDPFVFATGEDIDRPLEYLGTSPNSLTITRETLMNQASMVAAGKAARLRTETVDQLVRAASLVGPLPVCPL